MIVVSVPVAMSRPYQPAGSRARRIRRPSPGHDQQAGLVVNVGTGRPQAGLADPEVVAAQQQLNRVRAAGSRRHHHGHHRPCRAAASPRGNVQRYGSLQLGNELLARGGRPVRPPPLHALTIAPARTGHQGHCSRPAWPWVLLACSCRARPRRQRVGHGDTGLGARRGVGGLGHIRPADVEELPAHGATAVVLSLGMNRRLQVDPRTLDHLAGGPSLYTRPGRERPYRSPHSGEIRAAAPMWCCCPTSPTRSPPGAGRRNSPPSASCSSRVGC